MTLEEREKINQIPKKRLAICKHCSEFVAATTICKECGCIILVKSMFTFAKCPLDKWDKDNDTTAINTNN